jgi:hypothetical protein
MVLLLLIVRLLMSVTRLCRAFTVADVKNACKVRSGQSQMGAEKWPILTSRRGHLIPTIESMTTTSPSYKHHLLVGGKGTPGVSRMGGCQCGHRGESDELSAINWKGLSRQRNAFFVSWSMTPLTKRRDALLALPDALSARKEHFARTLTEEQVNPFAMACAKTLDRFHDRAQNLPRTFVVLRNGPRFKCHSRGPRLPDLREREFDQISQSIFGSRCLLF